MLCYILKMKIVKLTNMTEQGFSTMGMVLVLSLLGGILLTGLNKLVLSQQRHLNQQKDYYHAVNHTLSSLQWSTTLNWLAATEQWQCQYHQHAKFSVCIKSSRLTASHFILVRGQYGEVKHYHLASLSHGKLIMEKGHWLDYCPEKQSADCDE